MSWVIREYLHCDFDGCLDVIKSNTPNFFAASEISEFEDDLQNREQLEPSKRWPFFVLETSGVIRGCGGYFIKSNANSGLIWGMIRQEDHKKGLGTALLKYRFEHLSGKAKAIDLDTTPLSFGFYEKAGFIKTGFEKDGYALGMDKIIAQLRIVER